MAEKPKADGLANRREDTLPTAGANPVGPSTSPIGSSQLPRGRDPVLSTGVLCTIVHLRLELQPPRSLTGWQSPSRPERQLP